MEVCYVIMKEKDVYGNAIPVFATTDESIAIEKEQEFTEDRTYIMEVPFKEKERTVYYSSDDFEPLGCHGCGDW